MSIIDFSTKVIEEEHLMTVLINNLPTTSSCFGEIYGSHRSLSYPCLCSPHQTTPKAENGIHICIFSGEMKEMTSLPFKMILENWERIQKYSNDYINNFLEIDSSVVLIIFWKRSLFSGDIIYGLINQLLID